jgi:DNA-directed RNA polymerase subunit RPC12/RpoP
MCADFDLSAFEEAGCTVCGRLCKLSDLSPRESLDVDWSLLDVESVTQKERFSITDPVEEVSRPILAKGCEGVCTECESKLLARVRPPRSLANHLWIGELPWQLKGLTSAEKMMVTKVWHNRCVVRVASGRGKLVANAIMFATPIRRVYSVLPPSRDELSEVLVFVFLVSAKPTEDDFVHTPMFVRRQSQRCSRLVEA